MSDKKPFLVTLVMGYGEPDAIACDHNCQFAYGINARPKKQISDDDDDYVYLTDQEAGPAPRDPGTYEGGCGKPLHPDKHNKWCYRECERSVSAVMWKGATGHDWDKPVFNQPWKHKAVISGDGADVENDE
ncbi:MAG: hypothetical protein AAGJ97_07315 [Planctomycetota bacterium]